MGGNGVRIALACEDQAHRALATFLADRVLLEGAALRSADWINDESLPYYRSYCGRGESGDEPQHLRFYPLSQAKRDAEDLGHQVLVGGRPIKLRGFIDGKRLEPEANLWRRIFILFAVLKPPPDVLIVVHDTDGKLTRLEGLKQALAVHEVFPVIVATPHHDAEAWFVAGFVPKNEAEERRLAECKDELAFDPPDKPHKLTAHPNDARTDAKRVLRILVFNEDESRPPALDELPDLCSRTLNDLALLERRGEACLLAAFLRELRAILVPVLIDGCSSTD